MVGGCLINERLHHCGPINVSCRAHCCRQILSSWLRGTACLSGSDPFQKVKNWLGAWSSHYRLYKRPINELVLRESGSLGILRVCWLYRPSRALLGSSNTHAHTPISGKSNGAKVGCRVTVTTKIQQAMQIWEVNFHRHEDEVC